MQRRQQQLLLVDGGHLQAGGSEDRPPLPLSRNPSKSKQKGRSGCVFYILTVAPFLGVFVLIYAILYLAPPERQYEPNNALMNNHKMMKTKTTSSQKQQQHNQNQQRQDTEQDSNNNDDDDDPIGTTDAKYHIVFSTGCSVYQDWQSYIFFYQAMVVNQPGTVTRIVSGCNAEEQETLRKVFRDQIQSMNTTSQQTFEIHFTPDYSRLKGSHPYVYFNKPFGMKHWLENALGIPHTKNNDNEHAIVILMDPDQLIMRPYENNDFSNTQWKFIPKDAKPYTRIDHGKPMAQLYGFGMQWKDKVNMTKIMPPGVVSPVDQLSREDGRAGYIVGPPYVATARDMYKIVSQWCDFALPVHEQYPFLLAEMFAYSLGAAHQQLPHQTAISFMVSSTEISAEMEGWDYIDKLPNDQICATGQSDIITPEQLPNVFHFCQRYGLGKYFFGKRKLPSDFLTCESPLLQDVPVDIMDQYDYAMFPGGNKKDWSTKKNIVKRNAFSICYIIPAVNAAATHFKQKHCDPETANFKKEVGLWDN